MIKRLCLFFTAIAFVNVTTTFAQTPLWQQTNGPCGAQINAINFDSSGGVYVLSNNAFHSTDDGASWEQLPLLPGDLHTLPDGDLVGIIKNVASISKDHGHTWQQILNVLGSIAVTATGDLYVASNHLFRSTNAGVSWDTLPAVPQMVNTRFTAFYSSTLFLNSDYFYRSTDRGQSWSKIVNGITVENSWGNQLMGTLGGNLCYVAGDGHYHSSDDGRTWKRFTDDVAKRVAISTTGLVGMTYGASLDIFDLKGTSIKTIHSPISETNFLGTVVSPTGEFWTWIGPEIFKVNPAIQDTFTQVMLPNGKITEIMAPAVGTVIVNSIGLYDQGFYKSTDGGSTWQTTPATFISPSASDASQNIFAVNGEGISESTDGGTTWKSVSPQLSSSLTSLAIDAQGLIYAGGSEGVFRSTDGGVTWDQLNAGLTDLRVLSLTMNAASEVFVGTPTKLFHSTDHAMSWQVTSFAPPDSSGITSLVINTSGDLLAVVKNAGVFWSHDDAQTWSSIGTGLNGKVSSLLSTPIGHVFAGTDKGVFYLPTGGGTWVDASAGLGSQKVLSITRDQAGTVYLGTDGSGVYRSTQTYNIANTNGVVGNGTVSHLPMLYPNPSHGSITIDIPGMHNAKIQILDLLGRVITSATASEKWIWNSNAVAGTYIAHISCADEAGKTFQSYDRFVIEK
jgi:photosystem II stability/assembly factor-like uncharacterized protein